MTTSGVGAAATLVAAARAVATRRGLIELRDNGEFSRLTGLFAARTRYFDNVLADALRAGVRQAVILGSGFDASPYRLWWPAGATVYELDEPQVIELKAHTMQALGAAPAVNRRAVGVDLRQGWPMALRQVGFDVTQPTAWIAEGLLTGFLPPDAQDRLLDGVTALSVAGSRFAADYLPAGCPPPAGHERILAERWQAHGLDVNLTDPYPGEHNDVARYLAAHGWATFEVSHAQVFAVTGLPDLRRQHPADAAVSNSYVNATRT